MRLALFLPLTVLGACSGNDVPDDTGDPPAPAGPVEYTDVFAQELITPVDILWVIDGGWVSGIQALDDDLLDDTFETLLLADPSWKMGVLDSAARGPAFGTLLGSFETWPPPPFIFDLDQPDDSSRPRDAIYNALDLRLEATQNKDFIRSNAHLYIMVYTDRADASDEIEEDEFQQWLTDFQPSDSKRMSVITVADQQDYWADQAQGGIVYDVGSFEKAINTVYRDAIGQRTTFTLSYAPIEPPVLASIVFREHATEYLLDIDYEYDPTAHTISFLKAVPPPDSEVHVTYETADEVVTLTTPTTTAD